MDLSTKKGGRTGHAKRRGSGESEPLFVGSSTESCSEIERTNEIDCAQKVVGQDAESPAKRRRQSREPDPSLPLPTATISPAKTERTLASTHCFSSSVMMPASRRQLALKDMKEAEGASLIGKISSRFTGDFIALRPRSAPYSR